MAYVPPYRSLWTRFQDKLTELSNLVAFGPSTDPNKVAPPMAQYDAPKEWPSWCHSSQGPFLVKTNLLSRLPHITKDGPGKAIFDQITDFRLQRISHYKCNVDWNHEFILAELHHGANDVQLQMIWERDLPLLGGKPDSKREQKIKSGFAKESIDRITYISQEDFDSFVKMKDAYCLRTADFPSPQPDILQVFCVLETHSLSFPLYHVYSTMCYWYADSTFEVLLDIGKAQQQICQKHGKKGVFRYKKIDFIAYTGMTREALKQAGILENGDDETGRYQEELVEMQAGFMATYGSKPTKNDDDAEQELTKAELESIQQHGWNVAHFLSLVQNMPSHQTLLDKSLARADEVRAQLQTIQDGREKKDAKARREAEAVQCAEREQAVKENEDMWKAKMAKERERTESIKKRAERAEQRADQAEQRANQAERRADQAERRADQAEERIRQLEMNLARLQ